jgi:hypothetical protein
MMNNGISIKQRRLIIRLALTVLWIGLGIILFVLNRGHTILIDNHDVEALNLRAPDMIKISVDKSKAVEFFRRDRDIFAVGGSRHRARIEFSDGTPVFEQTFTLPLMPDVFLLSIPKMIKGVEPFIEVFHSQQEVRNRDDEDDEEDNGGFGYN